VLVFFIETDVMAKNNRSKAAPKSAPHDNSIKDPEQWTTGGEEMTGAQRSYLNTLAQEAGEDLPSGMSKADASKKIEELQEKTGRGIDH
jgi:hypothetical protein